MTINNELVNYFKEGLSKGNSIDVLKKELLNAGWIEVDINDSMNAVIINNKPLSIVTNNINNKINRPIGVSILAVLLWINAGVFILFALLSLFFFGMLSSFISGLNVASSGFFIFSIIGFIFFGLVSLFFFFFGRGLWRGKNKWRIFYLIISGLGVLSSIVNLIAGKLQIIFYLIISVLIFFYIGFKKNVVNFFRN